MMVARIMLLSLLPKKRYLLNEPYETQQGAQGDLATYAFYMVLH